MILGGQRLSAACPIRVHYGRLRSGKVLAPASPLPFFVQIAALQMTANFQNWSELPDWEDTDVDSRYSSTTLLRRHFFQHARSW
jgi:hypothetical protein